MPEKIDDQHLTKFCRTVYDDHFFCQDMKIFREKMNTEYKSHNICEYSLIKRVNRNKAAFSPRLLYLKSPEFCKNEIQKWGHLAPKNVKSKSPDFCIFFFKSWGSPHFCKKYFTKLGANQYA